ncbi:hypothetical protein TSUD_406700 [Trifolium subterraneum]|uniref:RNase H type-1 domain-containing protein n=1 Tax=Trifolium subterraneum TaxID=3900 RepID=A0A2Z6PG80_TRISU|nr:hypothetical protein TSUD_406700 [Trifolium subterraneum]
MKVVGLSLRFSTHLPAPQSDIRSSCYVLHNEKDPLLAEEVIPTLITYDINAIMTMLSSHQEIKAAVFALNKDSAPSSDGFGAFFFQHYWEIVKLEVYNVVLEFFTNSWILLGFNSNIISLLPKTSNATSIDQYRPIAMTNFKFKVISKIIADRLAKVMPTIISEEQMGFIHDMNIKDCLCIASEVVNLLHNKSFSAEGFFNCSRDVRQGDPLSPLLFCIAEDVLSRGIAKLGKLAGLKALKDLFDSYALQSGQNINTTKSTIFLGSITQGKPKVNWLQSIADKIRFKLLAWKACLLSMACRIQLVRAVMHSMLMYSISIYSWPVSLIKNIEKDVKNFIWSGDVGKKKLVTVAWKKICRPFSQGGLNIRSLTCLNKAINLKLCWSLFHSQSSWAKLVQARVVRDNKVIHHHIYSSLWSSIKEEVATMFENSIWLLGNGKDINFWNDCWCGHSLSEVFNIPAHISQNLTSSVSDYILNGHWNIPSQLSQQFSTLSLIVQQISIPLDPSHDLLLWKHTDFGELQLADAYNFILDQWQELDWAKFIWSPDIPPSKSLLAWRFMHNKVPTYENLKLRGSNCLDLVLQFTCMEDMWKICDLNWAPQCNNTKKTASNSIRDFIILKHFKVCIHQSSVLVIKEVLWIPPLPLRTKCNIDGAAKGNPGLAGCGGVFRNHVADLLFCFAEPLGFTTSFQVELNAAISAIEIAYRFHWHNLWIETDSALVVRAFQNPNYEVTWNLRNG